MAYKVLSRLKYNGVYYNSGDIVDIDPRETERLISLSVISNCSPEEEQEIIESSELTDDPEANDRNYDQWEYNAIKSEVKNRRLKTQGSSRVELTEALKADDIEFDSLILELESQGIELPEEATTNELKELLNQSDNSEVSNND